MPAVMRSERDTALYLAIGRRIRSIRTGYAFTQADLAREIGVSPQHVSHIETGTPAVHMHILYRIAVALGCKLSDLLPEEEDYARYSKEVRPARSDERGTKKGAAAHLGR